MPFFIRGLGTTISLNERPMFHSPESEDWAIAVCSLTSLQSHHLSVFQLPCNEWPCASQGAYLPNSFTLVQFIFGEGKSTSHFSSPALLSNGCSYRFWRYEPFGAGLVYLHEHKAIWGYHRAPWSRLITDLSRLKHFVVFSNTFLRNFPWSCVGPLIPPAWCTTDKEVTQKLNSSKQRLEVPSPLPPTGEFKTAAHPAKEVPSSLIVLTLTAGGLWKTGLISFNLHHKLCASIRWLNSILITQMCWEGQAFLCLVHHYSWPDNFANCVPKKAGTYYWW